MNQPAPRFTIHPDGLSTFIAIASNHIHELSRQEQLNQSDITDLNNALPTALYNIGAAFELLALERMEEWVPHILIIAAASFIYIAAADLIPTLHRRSAPGAAFVQFLLVLAGIGTIALFGLGG